MNILWICNILFPEAEHLISGKGDLKSSGGWMLGLSDELVRNSSVNLSVVTVSSIVSQYTHIKGERIHYYVLPQNKYNSCWKRLKEEVLPDVVHIHGTENPWGKSYVDNCGSNNVCVSIQGMLSAYYYYYYYGITVWEILRNITLYSIIKGGILKGYFSMKNNSKNEIELLQKVPHIFGRTSWDKARTWAINPNATYHYCGEILRTEFYEGYTWKFDNCEKHSIFLSQASYPIKGLHQFLKALRIVKIHYPDVRVRIAGRDITKCDTIGSRLKYSSYGRLIRRMIKINKLQDSIAFVGQLDAAGMRKEYLMANLFVSPSTIENSPNSLAEAQILGTPCLSSYVGGVMDMLKGDEDSMYRFEEYEMLAMKICATFESEQRASFSREVALRRHDRKCVVGQLLSAYADIVQDK